jgi:hypothetical protein
MRYFMAAITSSGDYLHAGIFGQCITHKLIEKRPLRLLQLDESRSLYNAVVLMEKLMNSSCRFTSIPGANCGPWLVLVLCICVCTGP